MCRPAGISVFLFITCLLFSFGLGQKARIKQLTPTVNGSTGFFHVPVAETLRQGEVSFGLKVNRFNRKVGDISITGIPISFTAGLHDLVEFFVALEVYKRVHADPIVANKPSLGEALILSQLPNGRTVYFNDTLFLDTAPGSGSGDIWTGIKLNLLSQDRGAPVSLAFQPHIKLALGDRTSRLLEGLKPGKNDYGFDMLASQNIGWGTWAIRSGFMAAQDWEQVDSQNSFNWGVGIDMPLGSEHVYFIGEGLGRVFFGERKTGIVNSKFPVDFYTGLRVHPSEYVTVSGAYGFHINRIDSGNYDGIAATSTHGWFVEVAFHRKVNRPPTVTCTVSPDSIIPVQASTIRLDIQDPDDDYLTVTWKANGGQLNQRGASAVFRAIGADPGSYAVIAEVTDGDSIASCSADITVNKDKKPPVVSCLPGRTLVTAGDSTTLRVDASDPNDDALTYSWTVDGRSVPNNNPSFELGTTGRQPGNYVVRVTVTDVDGMTASCEHHVTITRKPNRNPECGSVSLSRREVFAGEALTASLSATDPDGDRLSYSWRVDGGSRPATGSALSINTTGFAGGSHAVTASAQDDRGGTCSASATFRVIEKIIIQMDGSRPDNVAKAQLDEIALKMQQNPSLRAMITGHTDDRGSESGNERMGLRRAKALKAYLVKERGVDPDRIETRSAGESLPLADNMTSEGRKANRRGEIELFIP